MSERTRPESSLHKREVERIIQKEWPKDARIIYWEQKNVELDIILKCYRAQCGGTLL